jgi:small-conductance mechanosensitive channel
MESLTNGLASIRNSLDWLPDPVVSVLIILLAAAVALLVHRSLRILTRRTLSRRYPTAFSLVTQMRGLSRLALLIVAMIIAVPVAPIEPYTQILLAHILLMSIIALAGWAIAMGLHLGASIYLRRFSLDSEDNLLARKHYTQVRVLLRAADVLLILITVGAMLMTVPAVRQYGISLLTSAGVAGIVAGLAARPVLSNLFAGVQIAMTQPIRIEDSVLVEGEFGNIEEITSTYVVVRLWDLRRMILPLTYFIEKPFQNWTRETTTLIGTVFVHVDYRAPVAAIRAQAEAIVKASPKWDGRVFSLALTELEKDAMQLRILASARSSGQAFDLRCEIRERLIDWLQRKHPEALPRTRSLAQAEASDQKSLENAQTAAAIGADSAQTGTEA